MELKSIDNLDEILTNFHFDKIYCSEIFFKKITEKYPFTIDGMITLDGYGLKDRVGYILFKNTTIDILIDFSMSSIILGYKNIKVERKVKLDGIYNSSH